MWKPIQPPGEWLVFLQRKDIKGLPIMEARKRYMQEQLLFENYYSNLQTLNTVNTISPITIQNKGGKKTIEIPATAGEDAGDLNVRFSLDIDNQRVPVDTSYQEVGTFNDKPYYEIMSADPSFFPNRYIFWNIPRLLMFEGSEHYVGWFANWEPDAIQPDRKKPVLPPGAGWVMGDKLRSVLTPDSLYLEDFGTDTVFWENSSMMFKEYAHLPNIECGYWSGVSGQTGDFGLLTGELIDNSATSVSGSLTYDFTNQISVTFPSSTPTYPEPEDWDMLPSLFELSYTYFSRTDVNNTYTLTSVTNKRFFKINPVAYDYTQFISGELTSGDKYMGYYGPYFRPGMAAKDYNRPAFPLYASATPIDDGTTPINSTMGPPGSRPETIIAYVNGYWHIMAWNPTFYEYSIMGYKKGTDWLTWLTSPAQGGDYDPITGEWNYVVRPATESAIGGFTTGGNQGGFILPLEATLGPPLAYIGDVTGFRYGGGKGGDLNAESFNGFFTVP